MFFIFLIHNASLWVLSDSQSVSLTFFSLLHDFRCNCRIVAYTCCSCSFCSGEGFCSPLFMIFSHSCSKRSSSFSNLNTITTLTNYFIYHPSFFLIPNPVVWMQYNIPQCSMKFHCCWDPVALQSSDSRRSNLALVFWGFILCCDIFYYSCMFAFVVLF